MSKDYIIELEMETFDLIAKIVSVLGKHELWDEKDNYTFPDGDTWSRFEPEIEEDYLDYIKQENEDYGN